VDIIKLCIISTALDVTEGIFIKRQFFSIYSRYIAEAITVVV